MFNLSGHVMAKKAAKFGEIPESSIAQELQANPQLRASFQRTEKKIRAASAKEIEAVERGEQITKDDFGTYINARADHIASE